MGIIHITRRASADEIAREMDRRGVVIESLEAKIASQARRIEELEKGVEQARLFIASEYQDPAMEERGEWLPPEARKVHNALASLLNRTGEGL